MKSQNTTLIKAEFEPRLKTYLLIYSSLLFFISIIGIPLIPIWLIIAYFYVNKYFERLECELGTRSIHFTKGLLVRVERNIPLDKIQDIMFKEGPLLRWLGLSSLRIETAGQATPGFDLTLIGIKDASIFRRKVLEQRDAVTSISDKSGEEANGAGLQEILSSIQQTLQKIEENTRRE